MKIIPKEKKKKKKEQERRGIKSEVLRNDVD